jgi:hypothetical protein
MATIVRALARRNNSFNFYKTEIDIVYFQLASRSVARYGMDFSITKGKLLLCTPCASTMRNLVCDSASTDKVNRWGRGCNEKFHVAAVETPARTLY